MFGITEILKNGFLGNLTRPRELTTLVPMSLEEAAELCFTSPDTFRRWCSDRKPRRCAMRLLAIYAGYVPWPGWTGFFFNHHDGMLYHKDLKYGFTPGDLANLHWLKQELRETKKELYELRTRLQGSEKTDTPDAQASESENVVPFPHQRQLLEAVEKSLRALDTSVPQNNHRGFRDRLKRFIRGKRVSSQ